MKFISLSMALMLLLVLAFSGCIEQRHATNNTTTSNSNNDVLPWLIFWSNDNHYGSSDWGYRESTWNPTYYAPTEHSAPTTRYGDFYSTDASSSAPVTTSYGDFYDTDTSSPSSAASSTYYADFYDAGGISSFSGDSDLGDDFGDSDFGGDDFGGGSDFGGDDLGGGDDW